MYICVRACGASIIAIGRSFRRMRIIFRERGPHGETRVSIFLGSSGLLLIINVVNYLDYRSRIVNLDCRYDCIYEMCEMYDS